MALKQNSTIVLVSSKYVQSRARANDHLVINQFFAEIKKIFRKKITAQQQSKTPNAIQNDRKRTKAANLPIKQAGTSK